MQTIVLIVSLAVTLLATARGGACDMAAADKMECGYLGIQEDECTSKGCCWSPVDESNGNVPWCFASASTTSGYSLVNMKETANGYSGLLNKIAVASTSDIPALSLDITFETQDIVRVKITDAINKRWEIPQSVIDREGNLGKARKQRSLEKTVGEQQYKITYTENPFSFEVIRASDGVSLFNLDPTSFIFQEQYITFTTSSDASAATYGLGESARLKQEIQVGSKHTLWAADIAALYNPSEPNLYGSFPYYVQLVEGSSHGVMLMNSNGMDISLKTSSITFQVIGGIIDLYVFTGSSPASVVQQYTSVVGRPAMMPYWSLGFHNCKYGYTSLQQVEDVVANYSAAGIPLDTQWMDIDYMQKYKDFTYDEVNFPQKDVLSFVNGLHEKGQHFVPIIDPGIMIVSGYDAYEKGLEKDLFVKDLTGTANYMGQVWPGPVYFPDFMHPDAQSYWTDQIKTVHDNVPVDGLWIDMNEVSNFCNNDGRGQVCSNSQFGGCPAAGASQTDCCLICETVDNENSYDFPPYAIGNRQQNGALSSKTMSMSALHYGGNRVYDTHNIYGLTEQIATYQALAEVRDKRPFMVTRSSFLSSGVHTAKWTGDNGATWEDLQSSIVSLMDFSLFGVPMVGADICGFIYDTTEELCARWIEVGAFYPFARDHNTLGAAPQELYLWPSVAEASRKALSMRYQLLPYLYTLFYAAHDSGAMVSRALWMNFPADSGSVGVDTQFMLGDFILVSPVVEQGKTSVSAYFPPGAVWYSFQDRSSTTAIDTSGFTSGVRKTLDTPLTATNVHVKGGAVLPLQQAAMTTTAARLTPFTMLVALCPGGKAFGSLFWDDGDQVELSRYLSVSMQASVDLSTSAGTFSTTIEHNSVGVDEEKPMLGAVEIVGVSGMVHAPSAVMVNGLALASSQVAFNSTTGNLLISKLDLSLLQPVSVTWVV